MKRERLYLITFIFLLFMLTFSAVHHLPQSYSESLRPGIFAIYNGTTDYTNFHKEAKLIYIQIINNSYSNNTVKVENIIVNRETCEASPPTYSIMNSSVPLTFYFINPGLLGMNISADGELFSFAGKSNSLYMYKTRSQVQSGVYIVGIYFFNQYGIAEKVYFLQYGADNVLASNTTWTLWKTNLIYNEAFPNLHITFGKPVKFSPDSFQTTKKLIMEDILAVGLLCIILILIFRK
ncbi:hypothetical protein CM19_01250 [Candidatus Acidianus copahuensis]|uniref:Uncharacterized protein n=1 Tax=Candidatus Acidianus copahuensis TaxID=1160895 RepID=A0A031LUI2_9CREN|nr:hypothetical protein [Candidatus Acidianus copahuensis]EZQ11430.1 hypothetical protein CM19_01250 [Candidatus Acidianus copahuensis]